VIEASLLDVKDLDSTDREVATEVERCLIAAKAAPMPGEADLLTDVYASY
jgi:pyruvate dehydrogenase E1 component alpha subunit